MGAPKSKAARLRKAEYAKTPQRRAAQAAYRAKPGVKARQKAYMAARYAAPEFQAARKAYNNSVKTRFARWSAKGLPAPTRPEPDVCECCRIPSFLLERRLVLDHCHATGKFRGWLCFNCNTSIGKLGDDESGLLRAVEYLRRNKP
jgi:hypothetical protein